MTARIQTKRMIAPNGRRENVPLQDIQRRECLGWEVVPWPDLTVEEINRSVVGRHKGNAALVIASGPSVGLFAVNQIHAFAKNRRAVVWGVNNPWEVCNGVPVFCDYFLTVDPFHYKRQRVNINRYVHEMNPGCIPALSFRPKDTLESRCEFFSIDLGMLPETGPTYRPGRYFHGMSSGVAAIQHALHCRCDPIYLLGHDCCAFDGKSHGQGVRNRNEVTGNYPQGRAMMAGYRVVGEHAKSLGITIINLSPISAIECFEKRVME